MADVEDKEKAEKLAAARKRVRAPPLPLPHMTGPSKVPGLTVEQLKKKKTKAEGSSEPKKKAGKASKEVKETKPEEATPETPTEQPTEEIKEETKEEVKEEPKEEVKDEIKDDGIVQESEASIATPTVPEDEAPSELTSSSPQPETPSTSSAAAASHSRAASFSAGREYKHNLRRPSISADALRSPSGPRTPNPLSPLEGVPDIYRKQAQTISELTEANERLGKEAAEARVHEEKLRKALAEKDDLQEELVELKAELSDVKNNSETASKVGQERDAELEKLRSELEATTRQISLLSSQITQKDKVITDLRTQSSPSSSPDDSQELLRSKDEQIEAMEMEISNLRLDLEKSAKPLTEAQSRITALEEQVKSSDETQHSLHAQIDELKKKLDKAAERLVVESAGRSSAETKAREATTALEAQTALVKKLEAQVASWEKDHKTLKHLYKETDTLAQEAQKKLGLLEEENEALRTQIAEHRQNLTESRRGTGSMQADDDELDGMEEDERRRLQKRVRELEAQIASHTPKASSSPVQAKNNKERRSGSGTGGGGGGGFLSDVKFLANFPSADDDDFLPSTDDEADYAGQSLRQEEARRKREERLREVKQGLDKWKGYKLDLTTMPHRLGMYGNMVHVGEVFEV
ncbi:hypothetical protein DFH27DRAFT_601887 [Peziza echinospora]|nr:hypothetical protein DFH27DRAFT_601887 [Peziza echinospora]